MKLNINKDNWIPYKLGEVVLKKEENDKQSAKSKFDRFLKVEHMDAESLHIKRWSSQENGDELNPYFYKIFRKGQILFPTRNPHLKRTALASFDGICGEKTLTLEPVEKLILPELIPFLFHSDSFYAHTTGAIIGSTNPHVRWRDVANYEFLLPPKAEQARLAELLWAMDEVIEKEKELLEKYAIVKQCRIKDLYFGNNEIIKLVPLSEITDLITKGTTPSSLGESYMDKGINFIKIESLTSEGEFIKDKLEHIDDVTHEKLKRSQIQVNDLLFSIAGALGRCTIVPESICPANTNQALAIIRLKKGIIPEFILEYLKSDLIKKHIERVHVKGAQPNLSLKNINEFRVPLPCIDIQNKISREIQKLNNILKSAKNQVSSSQTLHKSLINQIF